MKISGILQNHFSVSFELFPPKTPEGEKDLFDHLKKLGGLRPSFVSVTYGAGGGTRERTRNIVNRVAREEKLNVMAHLAAVGHTVGEILEIVDSYRQSDIRNLLALRGDTPAGTTIDPAAGEIPHSSDLIRLIREHHGGFFSVGGAVFPEKHPESPDWESDLRHLKMKADAGMDFGISQLFFVNRHFFDFLDRCRKNGIGIPLIPGIMPITNFRQVKRMADMSGAEIPADFVSKLQDAESKPGETEKIGVEYAVRQCEELLRGGVCGLHFYTLNKSDATLRIYDAIRSSIPLKP